MLHCGAEWVTERLWGEVVRLLSCCYLGFGWGFCGFLKRKSQKSIGFLGLQGDFCIKIEN